MNVRLYFNIFFGGYIMNRFNKIMLLGLLSIVTGATSVKGAMPTFAAVKIGDSGFFVMPNPGPDKDAFARATDAHKVTKFISITKSNNKGDAQVFDFDFENKDLQSAISKYLDTLKADDVVCVYSSFQQAVTKFAAINAEDMQKIATLYACWKIKYGAAYPVDGKIKLNEIDVQLTDQQQKLARNYFIETNKGLLENKDLLKNSKVGFWGRNKGKVAVSAAAILGLAAAYVYYGNRYYDDNCSADASSAVCTATMPANYTAEVAATAATFISAAAGKLGNDAKQKFYALYQRFLSAPQTVSYPNCSQFDRPVNLPTNLPTCSLAEQPVEQVGYSLWEGFRDFSRGFSRAALWPFFRR